MEKLIKSESFISEKIWGGFKLNKFKNLGVDSKIGETYEVSTHKSGNSKVLGKDLSEFLDLSYLVKFIDASDNLSIQVHPDDQYASTHENDRGKMEAWIILESDQDSGIYLGLKDGVTKKELKNALEAKLDISKFLNFIPVKPGDFFILPEGLIHAIGKGVTLSEVQQSSGVTYRVWDWNRLDDQGNSRELHIEKALDVINFEDNFNKKYGKVQREEVLNSKEHFSLLKHKDFDAQIVSVSAGKSLDLNLVKGESLVFLKGSGDCDSVKYNEYDSFITIDDILVQIEALANTCILVTK